MLTKKARLWVIGIAVLLLIWTVYEQVYEVTAATVLMIGFLIWGYFKEGTVVMAAREFHAKNYEEAEILLKEIEYEVENTTYEFALNRLTALENFQSFIDIWHKTSELIKMEVVSNYEQTDILNPVYMMAFSGARGNLSQVSQLVGMRGFMSDPEGQIIDYPIRSNFREGLTLAEYVISCYGARKGLVEKIHKFIF